MSFKPWSEIPLNLLPEARPTLIKENIHLINQPAFPLWVIWFLYAVIPIALTALIIYFYFKRKKINPDDKII